MPIRQHLTEPEKETCRKFDQWLKKVFNSGCLLANRPVPFSTRIHNDTFGNLTIDNGNMILQASNEREAVTYRVMGADNKLLCYGESLERVLLDALQYAIHREFIKSYA